jgi:hypothetical protein
VRYRCIAQSLAQVVGVCAQGGPDTEKYRERGDNGSREDERYDLGRRLGVGFEDVVDLGLGGVAEGRLGHGERRVRVARDLEVEDLALVGRGRAERTDDDRGGNRLRGSEELVGEVLVRLWKSASSTSHCLVHIPSRPCPCRSPSH